VSVPARVDNPNVTAPPPPPAVRTLPDRPADPSARVWSTDPPNLREAVAGTGVADCLPEGRGSVLLSTAPMDGVDRVIDAFAEGADPECVRARLAGLHFERTEGEAHHSVLVP
jgi:hypothetical protein